ncbi:MAG: nickel/cobalt efflux protein RcnA, partial [Alphaproteobacteria bacterium]
AHGACCGHSHDGKAEAKRMMAEGKVGNWQIMLFGLTGGLIPCPASIAVLLVCIQLREFSLGAAMVGAFSLGLALTLVGVGVAAAWGRGKVEALYGHGRAEKLAKILPLASSGLMLVLGGVMLVSGLMHIL